MERVVISVLYYIYSIGICELCRQLVYRYVRVDLDLQSLLIEFFGTLQLCAALYENKFVAYHYGLTGYTIALAVVIVVHCYTFRTAFANPCAFVISYYYRSITVTTLLAYLFSQISAAFLSGTVAKAFWHLHFSDDYIWALNDPPCQDSLQVSVLLGFACEAVATGTVRWVIWYTYERFPRTYPFFVSFAWTLAVRLGLTITGAYQNPLLASSQSLFCTGVSGYQHAIVFWLGPVVGWLIASELYWPLRLKLTLMFGWPKQAALSVYKKVVRPFKKDSDTAAFTSYSSPESVTRRHVSVSHYDSI